MKNKRTTKRALLSSVVSLILCFSMLLGSTFAWFTDSVSSVNNIIKSGNLDVNLYYWDNSMETGTSVAIEDESDLTLFRNVDGEEILWEPGATGFGQFEVVNEGSLALKYQLMINYANATKTPEGKTLADVLSVYALARGYETGDDDVMEDKNLNQFVNNLDSPIPGFEAQNLKDFTLEGYLLPGESFKYELGAFWEPSDKDNEYNVKGGLSMDFGVTLVATQMTYEKDSYDDQYDAEATYPELIPTVFTLAELREAMTKGGEYKLGADITVEATELLYKADGGHGDGSAFLIKADTVLNLNGYNITVDAPSYASDVFFVNGGYDFTVKGNGGVTADCGIFVSYDANSTVNIEGGNYKCTANNDMLYAIWGKLNVSGGTYETAYWNLINIYGQGNISLVDVSGGSFKNWSPASSPDGNLLADGYKSEPEVIDGVTWYNVVPK